MKLKTLLASGLVSILLYGCDANTTDPLSEYKIEAETKEELSQTIDNFDSFVLKPAIEYTNIVESLDSLIEKYQTENHSEEMDKTLKQLVNRLQRHGTEEAREKYEQLKQFTYQKTFIYQGADIVEVPRNQAHQINPNQKVLVMNVNPLTNARSIARDDSQKSKNPQAKQQITKTPQRSHLEELFGNINYLAPNTQFIMHIEKESNKLNLYQKQGDMLRHVYNCPTTDGSGGKGPKEQEWDRKTPEGVYHVTKTESVLDTNYVIKPLFGDGKILIDYPSTNDLNKGRTGKGILICGTGLEKRVTAIQSGEDATYSSVVLNNNSIVDIMQKINGYEDRTLIVIESNKRPLQLSDYRGNL